MLDSDIERTEQMKELASNFPATEGFPDADISNGHPFEMTQLRTILLGTHDASTKLRTLKCGNIHWNFFKVPDKETEKMELALSHLESLQVNIHMTCPEEAESRQIALYLSKELLTMSIAFRSEDSAEIQRRGHENFLGHMTQVLCWPEHLSISFHGSVQLL